MPVYYGGDLYDLEDSDWDDPYLDVPEGMVHHHSRDTDNLDVLQDCQMDVAPVYQLYATRDEWDTIVIH